MRKMLLRVVVGAGLSSLLGGCAGNAPEALRAANLGTKVMSQLNQQAKEVKRIEEASQKAQVDALQQREDLLVTIDEASRGGLAAREAAGDAENVTLLKKLFAERDKVGTRREESIDRSKAYAATTGTIAKPLPDVSVSITKAQEKLAVMGIALDWRTQVGEGQALYDAIKQSVDDIKTKVDKAVQTAKDADTAAAAGSSAALLKN